MTAVELTVRKTVNAKTLKVEAGVRYWEDATVNGIEDHDGGLIPFRFGDTWCPTIDIDSGVVLNWPEGAFASIHYKVCDAGVYTLCGDDGEVLTAKEGYVPAIMSPGGSGYGDYIIMGIDAGGKIADWRVDLSDFEATDHAR